MESRKRIFGTESLVAYVIATSFLRNEKSWGRSMKWIANVQTRIAWAMVSMLPAFAICFLLASLFGLRIDKGIVLAIVLPIGLASGTAAENVRRSVAPTVEAARSRLEEGERARHDRWLMLGMVAYWALAIAALLWVRRLYFGSGA